MIKERRTRLVVVVLVALALAVFLLPGCGKNAGAPALSTGPTALDNLMPARSSLSTLTPDAKLLVVKLAEDTTPTATPVWTFVFGSPSTDKQYVVHLTKGLLMAAQEYGTVGLSSSEWAKVPGTDPWRIDSDAAYTKALAASGVSGSPAKYMMGLETYKSSTDTSTVEPFVWRVLLYPRASGEATIRVDVNATTGETSVRK